MVKVKRQKDASSQPQTDGPIALYKVAAMCPHMRAHWRHLANVIELVLPSAHPNLQPKRQIDRFSHFCTAHGRVSSGMPGHVFSPNCPLAWGSGPHLIHASLGPSESITQTACRALQPFLHTSRQSVGKLYNGPPLYPLKITHSQ